MNSYVQLSKNTTSLQDNQSSHSSELLKQHLKSSERFAKLETLFNLIANQAYGDPATSPMTIEQLAEIGKEMAATWMHDNNERHEILENYLEAQNNNSDQIH